MSDTANDSTKAVSHPSLSVRASIPRRFRGGQQFGQHPVIVQCGTLTADQLQAILNDPYLGVTEIKDHVEDAPGSDQTSASGDAETGNDESDGHQLSDAVNAVAETTADQSDAKATTANDIGKASTARPANSRGRRGGS